MSWARYFKMSSSARCFPGEGNQPKPASRLAMITVLQFAEGLTDRQAANAVRTRIDVKYALGLALEDQGFDFSVLSEFRARLVAGEAEQRLFEALLTHAKTRGWLKARGRQPTDSTHVLAAIGGLSRLECVAETLRHALNVLATVEPTWLQAWVPTEWFERYATRWEDYRLPSGREERQGLAEMEDNSCSTSMRQRARPGCTNCQRSPSYGRCGSSNSTPSKSKRTGEKPKTCLRPLS
jgi:transposase